jgi:hypothetical protein
VFVGTTLNVAGASTLAGITGSFNGTVGATTPAAGAFTTVSASGATTLTSASANQLVLTGGTTVETRLKMIRGSDDSGQFLMAGYGGLVMERTGQAVSAVQAFTITMRGTTDVVPISVNYTGLAVTGTLSATGLITAGANLEVGSGGNLVVGGASTYGQFIYAANSSAHTHVYFTNSNGNVGTISTSGSATSYNTSSDYRLKENVQPLTGALATVTALKPVTFNWKSDGSDGQGFIAHELQAVVPNCVTGEKDATEMQTYEISPAVPATQDEEGNELTAAIEAVMGEREVPRYQGIDTSFLVATLTAAIQEQQAIITALTTRITALEAK